MSMSKSEKIALYIVGGIILVWLIGYGITNANSQEKVVCNSPYIKVGNSCCLDENYNQICDNDEVVEGSEDVWEFNDLRIYGGTEEDFSQCYYKEGIQSEGGYLVYDYSFLGNIYSRDIKMSLFKQYKDEPEGYGHIYENYESAHLIVYTNYDSEVYGYDPEGVTCQVEEYYDEVFNEVQTFSFDLSTINSYRESKDDKYGFIGRLFYGAEDKPSEAKYIISCKGDESGNEIKRTFRFNIDYVDSVETLRSVDCR